MSNIPNCYAHQADVPNVAEKRSVFEMFFAWICLLAGYGYCRVFPAIDHPAGGALYLLVIFAVVTVVFLCKRRKFGLMPILMALSVVVLLPSMVLSGNQMIHFLVFTYGQLVWCYYIYAVAGHPLEKGFSALLPWDFCKALFIMPFVSLEKIFGVLFFGWGRGGKAILKIFLGVAIAIVPTVLVGALLSYDSAFIELIKKLFYISWSDFFSHFFSIIFAIPIGMYFYGLFYSSVQGKCDSFNAERCSESMEVVRVLPRLTVFAAAIPLLSLYIVFFVSQWEVYFSSAFSGVLPVSFTAAQYAREGFFQLCTVAVINLILLVAIQLFVCRKDRRPALVVRILSAVFSVITLGLIATALSKLCLYINRFGLTPKRVYAAWFMLILAGVFFLIIIKQIFIRFRLIPAATLVCVALFAVLSLSGTDSLIAQYNVDRYLEGSLDTVDVDAMEDLEDAAIPALIRLAKELDRKNGTNIAEFRYDVVDFYDNYLYNRVGYALLNAAERKPYTFYSFTLPRYRAAAALKATGIQKDVYSLPEDIEDTMIYSFNYDEEFFNDDHYVQINNFVNTTSADCDTVDEAVLRAKAECTVKYDFIDVYRDFQKEMWDIRFCSEQDGVIFDVYLGFDGITRRIVVD